MISTALAMTVLGCGGGGGSSDQSRAATGAVVTRDQIVQGLEDQPTNGNLTAESREGGALVYAITSNATHGNVAVDTQSGAFTYTPNEHFSGTDSFTFSASLPTGTTATGTITLELRAVDDPPEIGRIANLANSPDARDITVPLPVLDPDGDHLTITTSVTDESIADVTVDAVRRILTLRPKSYGETDIDVIVRDSQFIASTRFSFTVTDVTRVADITSSSPANEAISLQNRTNRNVDFRLSHNGRLAFEGVEQIVAAIRALPDEVLAEALERKIWRFVRDNVYHAPTVAEEPWLLATWPTLNSFGWGFCSNVAAVFVQIAEAAGYESRIWELGGHVVPELKVGDDWHMYDPDIAVYYYKPDGTVAGVADLAADPSLITAPINPIFAPGANDAAYTTGLAAIYSSLASNAVAAYVSPEPTRGSRITLPGGSTLTYPGRWTSEPTGYDGPVPYVISQFRQARLDIPANHTGIVPMPWVLWDIQGTGRVRALGRDFAAGSSELRAFLGSPGQSVNEVEIIENPAGLGFVLMINPLWYDMSSNNVIEMTGKDVWAIEPSVILLNEANRPPPAVPAYLRKPQA